MNLEETPEGRIRQDGTRAVKLEELSKEELIAKVNQMAEQLKKDKAFGLVFERQSEDALLNRKVNVPVIFENKTKHINNGGQENSLIIGDNFDSLTCLISTHRGLIDVIYIDPPYNTGNEDFIYNDKYVNPEDSFRHSKWLSFMEARLLLAKELLSPTGIIFVSIDDNEQAYLKVLMDRIFGEDNFVTSAPRKTSSIVRTISELQVLHDYLLIYKASSDTELNKIQSGEKVYDLEDENGKYRLVPFWNSGPDSTREARPNLFYDFYLLSDGTVTLDEASSNILKVIQPEKGRWLWSKSKFEQDKHLIVVNDKGLPYTKRYYQEGEDTATYSMPKTWLDDFMNAKGSIALTSLLGKQAFSYPKPVDFMKWLINLIPNKNANVLDFFAGSGTVGQAVIELNKADGGNRKFILCTNDEEGIGETVTYERMKRFITGKEWADGKEHETHEASLRYYNVSNVKRDDMLRNNLLDSLEDTIKLKEGVFVDLEESEGFTIITNNDNSKYVAILKNRRKLYDLADYVSNLDASELIIYNNGSSYIDEECMQDLINTGWVINFIEYPQEFINDYNFVDEKLNIKSMKDNNNV